MVSAKRDAWFRFFPTSTIFEENRHRDIIDQAHQTATSFLAGVSNALSALNAVLFSDDDNNTGFGLAKPNVVCLLLFLRVCSPKCS